MSSPEQNDKRHEALANALREAEERSRVFVPPTLDEAILKNVRDHFEGNTSKSGAERRTPKTLARWIFAASAFATVVIALLVFNQSAPELAREDINRDGRVDVLDALALAKAVEGKNNNERLDQNGDRQLDDSDVRAVAMAAVRLDRKPGI